MSTGGGADRDVTFTLKYKADPSVQAVPRAAADEARAAIKEMEKGAYCRPGQCRQGEPGRFQDALRRPGGHH